MTALMLMLVLLLVLAAAVAIGLYAWAALASWIEEGTGLPFEAAQPPTEDGGKLRREREPRSE